MSTRKNGTGAYEIFIPTTEEIAQRAAEVREAWSDDDFQKRAGVFSTQFVDFSPICFEGNQRRTKPIN